MRGAAGFIFFVLLAFCTQAFAADGGAFGIEMTVQGKELKMGPNTVDVLVHDKAGREVSGAELTVTPWMPEMGHGVWDKPVVTEVGKGRYRVTNVKIIMGGLWELRVAVRKGADEGKSAFPFEVKEEAPAAKEESPAAPKTEYTRTVEHYRIPDVTLLNQDGKRVNLRALLESGKPVVVDFIFTTCTTICPVLSAGFISLQEGLGEGRKDVQFVSITLDPEHDRPDKMKEYLTRYEAGEEWEFLTGSRDDVATVLKAFDAFVSDKMSHSPLYIMHGPNSDEWIRIRGLAGSADLMREFRKVAGK